MAQPFQDKTALTMNSLLLWRIWVDWWNEQRQIYEVTTHRRTWQC